MSEQSRVASLPLPTCAVKYNDIFLEQAVPGTRTESVSGLAASGFSITELSLATRPGAHYRYKRKQVVEFQVVVGLTADNVKALKNMERKLKFYVTKENLHLVMNDDPDYYRICNLTSITFVRSDTGGNDFEHETCTMVFHQSDPSIYSNNLTSVTIGSSQTTTFNYNGNEPFYPIFEITANGILDGFALFNQNGAVIQVGNMNDQLANASTSNFAKGDVITVDTSEATIKNNNKLVPQYGAVGNDWNAFAIQNGSNSFKFTYQKTSVNPTVKVKYREVF